MQRLKEVSSIEELYQLIDEDRHSLSPLDNRFPIRLIFINSFDELQKLVETLTEQNIELIDISDFLLNDYSWLTPDDLEQIFKNLSGDSIVLPVSEYMRFLDDNLFFSTFRKLSELETPGKRIYVPLIGLFERYKKFLDNQIREWVPIWKLNTTSKQIHIYQVNYDLDSNNLEVNNYKLIKSTKEWFSIWKMENSENIISLSKPLSFYYKNTLPDQTFDLEEITNPKEFMNTILKIELPIKYNKKDNKFWNRLIHEINQFDKNDLTFKNIFLNHFNIGNIDTLTIYDFLELYYGKLYYGSDLTYDHWLLRNFIVSLKKFKLNYFYQCFMNLDDFETEKLSELLWTTIFKMSSVEVMPEIANERREILKYIHENFQIIPNEDIISLKLNNIKNYNIKTKFNYLTNITQTERLFIFECLTKENISNFLADLKMVYPELYYYLDWDLIKPDGNIDNWIIEYFKEYNYSKVQHTKAEKIDNFLKEKNKNKKNFSKWYYPIPKADLEKDLHYIWVDGLGAEWFPFIVHYISKFDHSNGMAIKKKIITRVNIPSCTTCNKYNFEKIDNLDYFVHNQKSYSYPITLINEIEIVKDILKTILTKPFNKICIISDHGLSFLCTKQFGNCQKLNFGDSKHEGRYMWIDENLKYSKDDYYIDWNVEDGICKDKNAIVASKHVSLNKTPAREVHGGATPEEILVPFIILEKIKETIVYTVDPLIFDDISSSDPVITFNIYPVPPSVPDAFVDGKPVIIKYSKNNNEYTIDLKGFKAKKHTIKLKIDKKYFEIEVNIKSGFIEKDLLDF